MEKKTQEKTAERYARNFNKGLNKCKTEGQIQDYIVDFLHEYLQAYFTELGDHANEVRSVHIIGEALEKYHNKWVQVASLINDKNKFNTPIMKYMSFVMMAAASNNLVKMVALKLYDLNNNLN